MLAVKSNNLEIVNALLKAGADVNAKNTASFKGILLPHYGKTALIYAAEKSTPEIINALINVGADVNAIDNKHYKAIDYARNNEKLKGSNVLKRLEELSK